jgi:uncharacterized protein (TIGR00299 family) protein
MSRILYFDCFAGISGDMTLGALFDLGVDASKVSNALATLPLQGFSLAAEPTMRNGISGTQAVVKTDEGHHHRGLKEILDIIEASKVSGPAKALASKIFGKLAESEAKIHGIDIEKVHFHEVGALDAIVDIVGAAVALDSLGDIRCICSPIRVGHGTIKIAHGTYPIPAPATAGLLSGIPVFAGDFPGEWTTPTGAAILSTICTEFGPMPTLAIDKIGYGSGTREHPDLPNMLRLVLGKETTSEAPEVMLLETQIDDMNPETFSHLHDLLAQSPALDWYLTAIQMKKNRPGTLLTVLCRPADREAIAAIVLKETSTIGYRYRMMNRFELDREFAKVTTEFGEITIKTANLDGETINAAPEYEDCHKAALEHDVPLEQVRQAALAAWRK